MSTPKKCALLFFAGFALCQLAWIVTLPPFRGIDEVDHAYRAASVAQGQWAPPTHRTAHGRGRVVEVPPSIVRAAHAQCSSLRYNGRDNCNPIRTLADGNVTVTSSAGGYDPFYYGVVGYPSRLFSGTTSLYVMRIVSSMICAATLALAGWALSTWQRTLWPTVGLLIASTPMVIYSNSIVAPNGVEMASAIGVWCCLLGLGRGDRRADRRLLLAVLAPALVLAIVRPLGPLFLAAAAVTACLCLGLRRSAQLIIHQRKLIATESGLVLLVVVLNMLWMHAASTVGLGQDRGHFDRLLMALQTIPLYFLQQFGAFPFRDQPAAPLLYALAIPVAVWFVVVGLRAARGRLRWIQIGLIVSMIAGPFVFTFMTVEARGQFWQGRYGLPFAVSVVLVAALGMDRVGYQHRRQRAAVIGGLVAMVVAHVAGQFGVLQEELSRRPSAQDGSWVFHPYALIAGLTVLGWCILAQTLRRVTDPNLGPKPSPELRAITHA